jgi:RNA polymerase primary sigma factor
MATQTRTQARSEEQAAVQTDAPEKDSPLLDLSDAAVKRFIKTAKARGYVTYDELNAVLPSEEVSSEQIEDTMSMLSDMGITVVESEDQEDAATAHAEGEDQASPLSKARIRRTPRRPMRRARTTARRRRRGGS